MGGVLATSSAKVAVVADRGRFSSKRRPAPRIAVLVCLALLSLGKLSAASPVQKRLVSVQRSIETTRVLYGFDYENAVRLSPDGGRYLVVLYRGDLERNGNWVEFLSGTTESVDAAARGEAVARLFTEDHDVLNLLSTPIIWLDDNERVAFIWNDGRNPGQVRTLNLRSGQMRVLTQHERSVDHFDISADGAVVVYTSRMQEADYTPRFGQQLLPQFAEMLRDGFAVSDAAFTATALLGGYPDDQSRGFYSNEVFVASSSRPHEARRVAIDGYILAPVWPRLSPDGRWAVVAAPPLELPEHWQRYTSESLKANLAVAEQHPTEPTPLVQLWLIDVDSAGARPLWDVPYPGPPAVMWSSDSRSILISPTSLPVKDADAAGLAGTAEVELDVLTGRFTSIDGTGEGRDARGFRYQNGAWRPKPAEDDVKSGRTGARARIELREDPNTPPALFAVDTVSGRERMVLDLNPSLRTDFRLGKVEYVHWSDGDGRAWSGRLYYPVDHSPARRFPLVILTAPSAVTSPRQFSLRGSELTASVVSIAQPLASRNIAVLVMAHPDDPRAADAGTPREGRVVTAGYESAIEHLVDLGLADRERVGLVGYSRSGYYVQYAIAQSRFPFAAAIAADNLNNSYVQYLLDMTTWGRREVERVNGAQPFGDGFKAWLERAPGFNAARIRTPLRMEINNGGITGLLGQWELFSQLRYHGKPVELYVIPDIDHGSHGLLLPNQQLASLGGAVDWMDFWLNGYEDPDPGKAEQYERWRRLRELHVTDLRRPRPPLLRWTVTPLEE